VLPSKGELRDYQWEGVRWMLFNWSQNRNSILADEMGLGKTIQTVAFMQVLKTYQKIRGPFLIIASQSNIIHWQRELQVWSDMDVLTYSGAQLDLYNMRQFEFPHFNDKYKDKYKVEVVITTPEVAVAPDVKDMKQRLLSKIHWELIVVDEAHKSRKAKSKINAMIREEYEFSNFLLLTGTPILNNVDELWTLLNFIDREKFDDREKFCETCSSIGIEQLDALRQQLRPYFLRREKEYGIYHIIEIIEIFFDLTHVITVEKSVPPK